MQHTRGVILLCRYIGSSLPQLNINVKIDLIEFQAWFHSFWRAGREYQIRVVPDIQLQ